jgi:hypothetical protein
MGYFETPEDVRCAKCAAHPNFIIWDYTFDYEGNGLVHEYGQYTCQCGHSSTFSTNDPYEGELD